MTGPGWDDMWERFGMLFRNFLPITAVLDSSVHNPLCLFCIKSLVWFPDHTLVGPVIWGPDLLAGLAAGKLRYHLFRGFESAEVSSLEGGKGGGVFG